MSGIEAPGGVRKDDGDPSCLPGHQVGAGCMPGIVEGEVAHRPGRPGDRPLRMHVVHARREHRHRLVRLQRYFEAHRSQYLERFRERLRLEHERERIVRPLIERQPAFPPEIAGVPGRGADPGVHGNERVPTFPRPAPVRPERTTPAESELLRCHAGRRPHALAHPAPRPASEPVSGRRIPLHPDPQPRLFVDSVAHALEPAVPPAQRLLLEADSRPGTAQVRVVVPPRTDDPPALGRRSPRAGSSPCCCSDRSIHRRVMRGSQGPPATR